MWRSSLTLTLIALLIGCQKSEPQNNLPLQKITVAYTYQPQSTLVHVAVARGYFAEEKLEVQPQMRTYGKAALQVLLENKADFATVAETPIMFSVLNGDKIYVIANIEASALNNGVVARISSGISSLKELKGKRIGFTPGTTSEFFLDSLLTTAGFTRKDVHSVPLKPEEIQEAFNQKTIDAASIWNYPLTLIKQQLGSDGIVFYDRDIYTETFNIAVRQDLIRANPELAVRFLRALIKAEDFVAQHPDDAQSIMSAATKVDKSLIHEVWSSFNYHVVIDQRLLVTLEDETRWAMKNGLTDKTVMPDYSNYIYPNSLREIKPNAIKLSR